MISSTPEWIARSVSRLRTAAPAADKAGDKLAKAELAAVMRDMDVRDDVRAVVLTGAGKAFSAGFDISPRDILSLMRSASASTATATRAPTTRARMPASRPRGGPRCASRSPTSCRSAGRNRTS